MSKDTIYKEDAIRVASKECHEFRGIFGRIEERIKELPSADRPQGEWIHAHEGTIAEGLYCSNCGKHGYGQNYCPNCGAIMKGADDDSDNI